MVTLTAPRLVPPAADPLFWLPKAMFSYARSRALSDIMTGLIRRRMIWFCYVLCASSPQGTFSICTTDSHPVPDLVDERVFLCLSPVHIILARCLSSLRALDLSTSL